MDIVKETATALSAISQRGIDVKAGWYEENRKMPYIRLWYLGGNDADASDDDFESETELIQVTVFSHKDEISLINETINLMKKHGFKFKGRNSDETKSDERVYLKSARFELSKEMEE